MLLGIPNASSAGGVWREVGSTVLILERHAEPVAHVSGPNREIGEHLDGLFETLQSPTASGPVRRDEAIKFLHGFLRSLQKEGAPIVGIPLIIPTADHMKISLTVDPGNLIPIGKKQINARIRVEYRDKVESIPGRLRRSVILDFEPGYDAGIGRHLSGLRMDLELSDANGPGPTRSELQIVVRALIPEKPGAGAASLSATTWTGRRGLFRPSARRRVRH